MSNNINKTIEILLNQVKRENTIGTPQNELFSFHDLLKTVQNDNYAFNIPVYQRDYTWGLDKRQELLDQIDDITTNVLEKTKDISWSNIRFNRSQGLFSISEYQSGETFDEIYYGILYFVSKEYAGNPNGSYEIVDGQQRITTVYLLLLALYGYFNGQNNKKEIESMIRIDNNDTDFEGHKILDSFINDFLKGMLFLEDTNEINYKNFRLKTMQDKDEKTWKFIFQLMNTMNDNSLSPNRKWNMDDAFSSFRIQNKEYISDSIAEQKLNENMIDAFEQFDTFFRSAPNTFKKETLVDHNFLPDSNANKDMRIDNDVYKTFVYSLYMISVTFSLYKIAVFNIKDENSAPIIFETINSKGEPLTVYDILKSKLYKSLDENAMSYKEDVANFRTKTAALSELIEKNYKDNADSMLVDAMKFLIQPMVDGDTSIAKSNLLKNIDKFLKIDHNFEEENSVVLLNTLVLYNETYDDLWDTNTVKNLNNYFDNWEVRDDFLFLRKMVDTFKSKSIKALLTSLIVRNKNEKNSVGNAEYIKRNENLVRIVSKMFSYLVYSWRVEGTKANYFDNLLRKFAKECKPSEINKIWMIMNKGISGDMTIDPDGIVDQVAKFNKEEKQRNSLATVVQKAYSNDELLASYIFSKLYYEKVLRNEATNASVIRVLVRAKIEHFISDEELNKLGLNYNEINSLPTFIVTKNRKKFDQLSDLEPDDFIYEDFIYGEKSLKGKDISQLDKKLFDERADILEKTIMSSDVLK